MSSKHKLAVPHSFSRTSDAYENKVTSMVV